VAERKGKLLQANKGTLFLDEISSMPMALQGKFLRAIESKSFFRLGDDELSTSDFRLVSASNRDLEKLSGEGKFREDLYYRISTFKIFIPPLRERKEDIPYIAKNLIERFSETYREEKKITDEAIEILSSLEWKGNVREIQSFLLSAYFLDEDKIINSRDLFKLIKFEKKEEKNFNFPMNLKEYIKEIERQAIYEALMKTKGNVQKAAEMLKMPRKSFYRKLKNYKLKF